MGTAPAAPSPAPVPAAPSRPGGARRLPPARAVLLAAVLALLPAVPAPGADPHDRALGLPYAVKAAVPVLLLPEAFEDPDRDLAPVAALAGLLTVPNALVLHGVHAGDGARTARWRRIAYAADLGAAAGLLGWGLWTIHRAKRAQREAVAEGRDPGGAGPNPVEGAARVLASLPLLLAAQLDLIPFRVEGGPRAALRLAPHGRGTGAGAAVEWVAAF